MNSSFPFQRMVSFLRTRRTIERSLYRSRQSHVAEIFREIPNRRQRSIIRESPERTSAMNFWQSSDARLPFERMHAFSNPNAMGCYPVMTWRCDRNCRFIQSRSACLNSAGRVALNTRRYPDFPALFDTCLGDSLD